MNADKAKQYRAAVAAGLLFLGTAVGSGGASCLDLQSTYYVGKDFGVRLHDAEGRPVANVRLRIRERRSGTDDRPRQEIAAAVTDANGHGSFVDVRGGAYVIEVDHPAGRGSGGIVYVIGFPGRPRSEEISIRWPAEVPTQAKALAGSMYEAGAPLGGVTLNLIDAVSGDVLANRVTDEQGRFEFPQASAGWYFIRVSDWEREGAFFFVYAEVNPSAEDEKLDLVFKRGSCDSMGYVPRRLDQQQNLRNLTRWQ